ncbi:MAG: carbon-nitrogen hydrolase family protein [Immundisolibacter sp.]|uniref:carbon-nitrogen hydrolase family protein n=1 Tax=Immundisolibacter sp. TaxID=1934948 RepID=UPI0019A51830|nr:carbon-nitrogen hydrolase family protein [Immundisolibacter sp.]MBC7162209.1 carbon-nitrogen hydrolase family protein [Immundisolibacter sp.]
MKQAFTAAVVQMVSGSDLAANLASAGRLIGQAAQAGARLVALPENFALLGRREQDKLAVAEPDGAGPIQDFLAEMAQRHGIYLVGGTIPLHGADPQRVRAACLLHGPDGRCLARYDKIHLFDVEVGDPSSGERYRESASIEPGDAVVTVDTELGCIGLAVCYDLRFPELFRALLARGAQILVLPSAFTEITGAAHWHLLCRARAVENLCYLLAPGQGGQHDNGRRTYGHSLIAGPWGEVLAEYADTGEGVACAQIDLAAMDRLRARFPALLHRRL